jgi:hypothetical protein
MMMMMVTMTTVLMMDLSCCISRKLVKSLEVNILLLLAF